MLRCFLPLLVMAISLMSVKATVAAEVLVLNTTGKPPLNTPNQDGFMDEVAATAMSRIGIELKTVELPAERGLKNVNAGIEDGEMSRINGLEDEYPNMIRVPEKIMDWEFVIFSRTIVEMDKGWQALSGQLVSYINGWKILEKNIPRDAEVTRVRSAEQLFELLRRKRTDYVIYERWAGISMISKPELGEIKIQEPPLASSAMYMYLNKKHGHLVPLLSDALVKMKEDGSYQELFNKHLSDKYYH